MSLQDHARDAYVFAYPMLENYKTMYEQAIDQNSGKYLKPFNQFYHYEELAGPVFSIVTPNNDTLYSLAWLDLRKGPVTLEVPAISDRYYCFQMVDLYTHNFDYIGTRATGVEAGTYRIMGPEDAGAAQSGDYVSEGHFVLLVGRTEIRGETDLQNVLAIQQQYRLTPPAGYVAPPASEFPVWDEGKASKPEFVDYFNFLLSHLEINDNEKDMIASWSDIGVGGSSLQPTDPNYGFVELGIINANQEIEGKVNNLGTVDPEHMWERTLDIFGNRQEMLEEHHYDPERYLVRAGAAQFGLYGNTDYEAYYPKTSKAAVGAFGEVGAPLNSEHSNYTMQFPASGTNPVTPQGFWSISIYKDSNQMFVGNVLERYSLGDRSGLLEENGMITLYIQQDPVMYTDPNTGDEDYHPNWLPAPGCQGDEATLGDGEQPGDMDFSFYLAARLYLPTGETITEPGYSPPGVVGVLRTQKTEKIPMATARSAKATANPVR